MLSGLALVLLTLVGYSSGAVLIGRDKQVLPGLLDMVLVIVLWSVACATRTVLGRWLAILVWLVVGLTVGSGLTALRKGSYATRRQEASATVQSVGGLRRWWRRWQAFAIEMGNYQGRVLLNLFYFVVVTPFGVLLRFVGDPLQLRPAGRSSFWLEREAVDPELDRARDQF